MVGNNYVKSQPPCLFHLGQAGDAAVNGNHQADALPVKVLQGRFSETVAFGQAVWYVRNGFATKESQPFDQQGGGADTIGIIVAVDGHLLAGEQSPVNPGHRLVHIGHQERVSRLAFIAGEEGL